MQNRGVATDLDARPNWLQRVERDLVDRMAERHLARLGGARPGSRGVTFWWQLLAFLVVLPVHALTIAAALGGLVLLVRGDNWMVRGLGVALLLVAIGIRPQAPRRPPHVVLLTSADSPELFGLLRAVAGTNGAPMPHEVLIVDSFNAFAFHAGWRRRRILGLGAPLWVAASPQARVALIGHELGHFAHGDLTHSRWVGSAEETLFHWLDIAGGMRNVVYGGVDFVQTYLMAPLRALIMAYLIVIAWINAPARQRQEYLADLDAARAGGSDGALALLDVLLSEPRVETAMTRAAVSPDRPDMWAMVSADMAALSQEDVLRRRSAPPMQASRIDDSHPATPLRIRLLASRPAESAAVVMDAEMQAAVDAELGPALNLAAKQAGQLIRYQR